jgi:hypothetical protein
VLNGRQARQPVAGCRGHSELGRGRSAQMAEPIANDWKAIHDRMQQIRAERSASFRHCPQCGSRGWVPNFLDGRQSPFSWLHCLQPLR